MDASIRIYTICRSMVRCGPKMRAPELQRPKRANVSASLCLQAPGLLRHVYMSSQRRSCPQSWLQAAVCRRCRLRAMMPSSNCEQLDSCQGAADHATDASCPRPVPNLQTAPMSLELCGFSSKASRTTDLWHSYRTKSRTYTLRAPAALAIRDQPNFVTPHVLR